MVDLVVYNQASGVYGNSVAPALQTCGQQCRRKPHRRTSRKKVKRSFLACAARARVDIETRVDARMVKRCPIKRNASLQSIGPDLDLLMERRAFLRLDDLTV